MADHGGRSAASAQVAALETRRAKQEIRGDRLREQWRARAAEHGLPAREVERILRPGSRIVPFAEPVPPEAMTRDVSVFGRPELLQALAEAQPRGAKLDELERLADAALAECEVVALPHGPAPAGTSEARFTTRELLDIEQDLLTRAREAIAEGRAQVPADEVVKACGATTLSDDQRAAVASARRRLGDEKAPRSSSSARRSASGKDSSARALMFERSISRATASTIGSWRGWEVVVMAQVGVGDVEARLVSMARQAVGGASRTRRAAPPLPRRGAAGA